MKIPGAEGGFAGFNLLALLLFFVFTLAGCQPEGAARYGSGGSAMLKKEGAGEARLTVFLQLQRANAPAVRLEIEALELQTASGWLPLLGEPFEVDAGKLAGGQKLAGTTTLAAGRYRNLRLTLSKAVVNNGAGENELELRQPSLELTLDRELELERGDSRVLLLVWDVESSLRPPSLFEPAIAAVAQAPPMLRDLLFVACPELDTVFAVRRDTNHVVAAIGVPDGPVYLGIDSSRNRLYALARESSTIQVVDLNIFATVDRIRIPLIHHPVHMTVDPKGETAFVVDSRNNSLTRMDLVSGRMEKQVILGNRPNFALYLDKQQQVALTSPLENSVLLLDATSLALRTTVAVSASSEGMAADETFLYVTDRGSNTVSVYEFSSGQVARTHTGFQPHRLLVADTTVYVTHQGSSTVSTFRASRQLTAGREIRLDGKPLEMVHDADRRWVYVGSSKGFVQVIDAARRTAAARIELGGEPGGMAFYD